VDLTQEALLENSESYIPYGIYGYHALTFLKNWMRTAKEK